MNIQKRLSRALDAQQSGDLETAVKLYRQVVNAAPSHAQAHQCLGSALFAQGDADGALSEMRRAVQLKPDYALAHNAMGVVLAMRGSLDDAQAAFTHALKIKPEHAEALCNLGDLFALKGQHEHALQCFERALKISPDNGRAMNNLGNTFLAMGLREQAMQCYEQALQANPQDHVARQNLESLAVQQVPQWHFDMLADNARNLAYQQAIERAVEKSTRVLDIGTGTGLLSMMAARAGARSVTTCETERPIAQAAVEIIRANGYADQITVHNKPSTQLTLGEGADLEHRVDLLVSEILDNKLLGEGALPSLRHANEQLLTPGGSMIPRAGRIKAVLVEVPERRATHPLRDVCGFDLSSFERLRDPNKYITVRLEHENVIELTPLITAWEVDFANLPPATQDTAPNLHPLELVASTNGTVHGVAFWFELDLDTQINMNSGPEGALKHWQQNLYLFADDLQVAKGDRITLQLAQSDMTIRFRGLALAPAQS